MNNRVRVSQHVLLVLEMALQSLFPLELSRHPNLRPYYRPRPGTLYRGARMVVKTPPLKPLDW